MPARGLLTFLLSQDECELEDLVAAARVPLARVRAWIGELEVAGYAVVVDDVLTVSDDPSDLPGPSAAPAGGGDVRAGVPDVVWAALKSSRPGSGSRGWSRADRAVVDAARLTLAEREAIEAKIDQEAAAAAAAAGGSEEGSEDA